MKPLDRIRDYVVWGRMAEGGMADVWLARHVDLHTPVIIKTLKLAGVDGDRSEVTRLYDEARLEARIGSPRVVRVIDTGTHEGSPFLVKEYVDGLDLREVARGRQLALGRTLPLWCVSEVARQTAEALEAAHRVGIVHRDVKPSNVIGANLEFKLTDFGLAVHSQDGAKMADRGGTLRFMAPETLRGEPIDKRVDIFALGATAYQLRYGFSPFPTLASTLNTATPRFPAATSSPETAFQNMLSRMLAKSADARPTDLAEPRRLFSVLSSMLRPALRAVRSGSAYRLGDVVLTIHEGDIATHRADAIVNSANCEMRMQEGVGAALVGRGGEAIAREAAMHGDQPLGACVATTAGSLRARHVLHAVCAWQSTSCVGRAMQATLLTAAKLGERSLAVPALGTGAAGVPFEASALSMVSGVCTHVLLGGSSIRRVSFVLADAAKLRAFRDVLESVLFEDAGLPPDVGLPAPPASVEDRTVRVDPSAPRSQPSAA
jgi:O-acetyl-ADP-ribose deacetylase (regulator of RNase III)